MTGRSSVPSSGDDPRREYLFKVLVIGEQGTGKTAIVKRYVHSTFTEHYKATVGVDFALKIVRANDGTIVRLQLWDIAGQERFGNMTRVFYKEAVGCIIAFDVTRATTFDAVSKWKADLDSKVQLPNGNRIPCILLANKCDLAQDGLTSNAEQMNSYCREKGFDKWFETSAKENINIETSIQYLINEIMKHTKDAPDSLSMRSRHASVELTGRPSESREEGGGGCCGGKS